MYGPFLTRSRNVDVAWRSIVKTVIERGSTVYTERKNQKTLECLCGIAHITDWRTGRIVPQNYIGLSEQIIEQQYWPQYASAERGEHTYTYGWCMRKRFGFNQIQHVVETLKNGVNSAFAQFWNPVVDSKSPDPPCIDIVMFQRGKDRINIVEYIRSNDVARAWPEDVSGSYAVFLTEVAAHFGGATARGDLLTIMGSAHVYDTTLEEVKERFRSSYSASNLKPMENSSTLFGPVLRTVKAGEKCSEVLKEIAEKYSQRIEENNMSLHVCLKVMPTRDVEKSSLSDLGSLEDTGKLSKALRHFEGANDEGLTETIDQIAWAKAKIGLTPESRRIVVAPNSPSKREYDINPIIIQFLLREETLHTIALYRDMNIESIDQHLQSLLTISNEVRDGRKHFKLGPLTIFLAPVSL